MSGYENMTNKVLEKHSFENLPKLELFLRENSKYYLCRIYTRGAYKTKSTKETKLENAKNVAIEFYEDIRYRERHGQDIHEITFRRLHKKYLGFVESQVRRSNIPTTKLRDIKSKLNKIQMYFGEHFALNSLTKKKLIEYRENRLEKNPTLTDKTIHQDFVALRGFLKYAVDMDLIANLPSFPQLKKIDSVRDWFSPGDYKLLLQTSRNRIKGALNDRIRETRLDLHDYILLITHSCCRVDEIYNLRRKDITEIVREKNRFDDHLFMNVTGKTGTRLVLALMGAVRAVDRLDKRKKYKKDDRLFPKRFRITFNNLLDECNLKYDNQGKTRNLKSLRSTGICFRILNSEHPDLNAIKNNTGTSIAMLDRYYLKPLNARLNKKSLLSFKSSKEMENPFFDTDLQ